MQHDRVTDDGSFGRETQLVQRFGRRLHSFVRTLDGRLEMCGTGPGGGRLLCQRIRVGLLQPVSQGGVEFGDSAGRDRGVEPRRATPTDARAAAALHLADGDESV